MSVIQDCAVKSKVVYVLLDRIPLLSQLRFQVRDSIYLAVDGDYARHFRQRTRGKSERLSNFVVTLTDGTQEEIWDPTQTTVEEINRIYPEYESAFVRCSDRIEGWRDKTESYYGTVLIDRLSSMLRDQGYDSGWEKTRWCDREFVVRSRFNNQGGMI